VPVVISPRFGVAVLLALLLFFLYREVARDAQEFLVKNWGQTELGKEYDIYEENGEKVGDQYETDTGPIDILRFEKIRRNCWSWS
jgi:hypothetical protein